VFKKFKMILGGEIRLMLTGSAPIEVKTLDFLKICFCCPFLEGYGMTETTCAGTTTLYENSESGTIGGPIANVRMKLKDLPELCYLTTDKPNPRGEIMIKSPCCMEGYFMNPEKTEEAL
jgi:long-chain acyl-CoA synthetase